MDAIVLVFLVGGIVGLIASVLMFVRNEWLFQHRIRLINDDWQLDALLPSYDEMMRRFWVWDFDVFVREARIERRFASIRERGADE